MGTQPPLPHLHDWCLFCSGLRDSHQRSWSIPPLLAAVFPFLPSCVTPLTRVPEILSRQIMHGPLCPRLCFWGILGKNETNSTLCQEPRRSEWGCCWPYSFLVPGGCVPVFAVTFPLSIFCGLTSVHLVVVNVICKS